MTTDVKNNLWVCHYRGACISVYDLKGNKIHKINIPAKNVTNCTFGGSENNEIFHFNCAKGNESKRNNKISLIRQFI